MDRHLFLQREGSFLTCTRNREDLNNIAVVKSTLKILPRHSDTISIRIKGHDLKNQVAYFISNQYTKMGLDPKIHVIDGIYNIKGKLMLYVMVAHYINKHATFNKGQCIGHMEPLFDNMSLMSVNSVITQKMMDDQVQLATFTPPLHNLSLEVKLYLDRSLESFKSQLVKDESSIGTTNLTKMLMDMGNSKPVSQKPYPIAMKHYDWVKDEINKLLDAKVIHSSHSNWSPPFIVIPKSNSEKHIVTDCRALNNVTQKFIWPRPNVQDIFSKLNGVKYFFNLGSLS